MGDARAVRTYQLWNAYAAGLERPWSCDLPDRSFAAWDRLANAGRISAVNRTSAGQATYGSGL
jgi:hypothetical protein